MNEEKDEGVPAAAPVAPVEHPVVNLHGAQTDHPANALDSAAALLKSADHSHVGFAQRLADQAIESVEAGNPEPGDQEILETGEADLNKKADLADADDDDSSDEDE